MHLFDKTNFIKDATKSKEYLGYIQPHSWCYVNDGTNIDLFHQSLCFPVSKAAVCSACMAQIFETISFIRGGAVVSTVALQQEGCGFDSKPGPF